MVTTIFECCEPRDDVRSGAMTDADFAADLAQVVNGTAPFEYRDPATFFATTYPTEGLKSLLANVCSRLSGGSAAASVFRLDTSFGGGKTHGLIALVHAVRGMAGVSNAAEFIEPAVLPRGKVRIAEFDGENADPMNGRAMGEGVFAKTPWGEIAYRLAGREGYERVRRSDEHMIAPGAETLRELFGGEPTLVLLDEMADWLRKVRHLPGTRDQLAIFLKALFKAVEATPNCAVVFALAIGKEGKTADAHGDDALFIADRMAEAESIAARKATLLNPTEDHETALVLCRRLFKRIDQAKAAGAIAAYQQLWHQHRSELGHEAGLAETLEAFRRSYPFHPEMLAVLTGKTATLANFQRVRGMLRLLGRTIAHLWQTRPADATAVHLHHIDPGFGPTYQEIATRLGQSSYVPAVRSDITAEQGKTSLAQELDEEHFKGIAPYTRYVARTAFIHTLAFQEPLRGVTAERLRYAILGPALDLSFINSARARFIGASAYLDDRPGAPMRFLAEANLTQVIRREERNVDSGQLRVELSDRIKQIFRGAVFEAIPFPSGPYEVADEVGDGRPRLAVMSYDAVAVGNTVDEVPDLIARIHKRKGSDGSAFRERKNNLVFVLADDAKIEDMRVQMARRLALRELKKPERIVQFAEHQQAMVREREAKSEADVALAIQQCYRHLFYPAKAGALEPTDLAHTAIQIASASEKPGLGQQPITRQLRELKKLRSGEDEPDSPAYIRDRTPLKKGQITTAALREEFRRDPALPILVDDVILQKAVERGVQAGEYVYRRGELLYGKGDPITTIQIDQEAAVFTMAFATAQGVWPRQAPKPPTKNPGVLIDPVPPEPGTGPAGPGSPPADPKDPSLVRQPLSTDPIDPKPRVEPLETTFSAEGVLKEALHILWERLRAKKVAALGRLTISMYDAGDGFRLLGAIAAVPNATKTVTLQGGYETVGGSSMSIEFEGTAEDTKPVKEFLEPQLRASAVKNLKVTFTLGFVGGLSMGDKAPEMMAERLVKFASGAAYVSAMAEVAPAVTTVAEPVSV